MKISKRGVTFLLCLGILASTSLGTLSAFADDWTVTNYDALTTTYVQMGSNDFVYKAKDDDKTVLKAKKKGYYALFAVSDTTWYATKEGVVPFRSLTLDENIEFTDVDTFVSSNAVEVAADTVICGYDKLPRTFCLAYKESVDSVPTYTLIDIYTSDDDAANATKHFDMFNVYAKESDNSHAVIHVGFVDETGGGNGTGRVTTSLVYFVPEEGDRQLLYTATDADGTAGGYDCAVYANGTYEITGENSYSHIWSETINVTGIEYGGNPTDEENADNTDNKPNITVTRSTYDTGLSSDSVVTVTVTADRECDFSCDGFPVVYGSKSAEFNVTENGSYTFIATDSNTGESAVAIEEIRQFGNGDFPDDAVPSNDPPQDDDGITDENKDDYWDKKKDDPNFKDDEGNGVEPLSFDTTNKPSDGMSALPQTGITSWVAMLACAIGAIALGTLLMFRKGIFGRIFGKGGSQ